MLVRGELRRLHLQCLRKVKEFAVQYNILQYLQDEYMTLASDRYVLPLKANFKGRIQGIIHDYSNTGETCYFEPMFLVELNNRLQELKREEREEERRVLQYLTGIIRNELPLVRSAWTLLVRFDVELAKCGLAARFRRQLRFCFPRERGCASVSAVRQTSASGAGPGAEASGRSTSRGSAVPGIRSRSRHQRAAMPAARPSA